MKSDEIVLYGIGGLGADERVFMNLDLVCEIIPIKWIKPGKKESLAGYAKRIAQQIDEKEKFGLIGVSFGGMIAIELNEIVKPEFTILISSASKSAELPRILPIINSLSILPLLPNSFLKPPFFIMKYLFGAQNSKLMKEILNDTDIDFIRWALSKILAWKSEKEVKNLFLIHGLKDRLIPLKNSSAKIVEGGGHFMVVDRALQVSEIVNGFLSKFN